MSSNERKSRFALKAAASCECGARMWVKPGGPVHQGDQKIVACPTCGGESVVLADADHDVSAEKLARIRRKERQASEKSDDSGDEPTQKDLL